MSQVASVNSWSSASGTCSAEGLNVEKVRWRPAQSGFCSDLEASGKPVLALRFLQPR